MCIPNKNRYNPVGRKALFTIVISALVFIFFVNLGTAKEIKNSGDILGINAISQKAIVGGAGTSNVFLNNSITNVAITTTILQYSEKVKSENKKGFNLSKGKTKVRSYEVKLKDKNFVPNPLKNNGLNNYFQSLNLTEDYIYVMVQFEGEMGDPSIEQIEEMKRDNITLFESHGDYVYYAKIPRYLLEFKSYNFIRWIGIINQTDSKIIFYLNNTSPDFDVLVVMYELPNSHQIEDLKKISNHLNSEYIDTVIPLNINKNNVKKLANLNFVKEIWLDIKEKQSLDRSVPSISSDFVWTHPNDGSGITVGVIDSGIQHNHNHFSSINIYDAYDYVDEDNYPEMDSPNSHGTHVAGIISGGAEYGMRIINGTSSKASLVIQRIFDKDGSIVVPSYQSGMWENIIDPDNDENYDEESSSDIISCSWTTDNATYDGNYTPSSEQVDNTVIGNNGKEVAVIFSAGNDGHYPNYPKVNSPATSKNSITVGASADYFSEMTSPFGYNSDENNLYKMEYSSVGTTDGRVKPDILAPGSSITSSIFNNTYSSDEGTSMAAPHVAGVAAQILKQYPNLSPAGVKAFLLSQTDGGSTTDNINYNQGWGRLNAHRAVFKLPDEYIDVYDEGTVGELLSGEQDTQCYEITVPNNANVLIVTLVWSDKPGDDSNDNTKTLYNDIDLWLKNSTGTTLSWTENDDEINNVEKYIINNPRAGTWEACVSAIGLYGLLTGEQDYAIKYQVVKNNTAPSMNLDIHLSDSSVEIGENATVYANIDINGISAYDILADLDVSSGLTLLSSNFDGSDGDKDKVGDISAGKDRDTRIWIIKGDSAGQKTVTIEANANRIDGGNYTEIDSVYISVGMNGTGGEDPGGNITDCEETGYDQCIAYEYGDCGVSIAVNHYDSVNDISWGLVNDSFNPYVIGEYQFGWKAVDADQMYYDCESSDCNYQNCTCDEVNDEGVMDTVTAPGIAHREEILGHDKTALWACWVYFYPFYPGYINGVERHIFVLNCFNDSDCSSNEYCDKSGNWNEWSCISKKSDGLSCTSGSVCQSGYCDNDGLGATDDSWCFSPVSIFFDGQEPNNCEYSTGLGIVECDEYTMDTNLDQCIGLPYYEDECSNTCTYQDVTSIFECTDIGCSCFESLCDGLATGNNVTTCSSGKSYFADKCTSTASGTDRDNICRSNSFISGCTAASNCSGVYAGTNACNISCGDNQPPSTPVITFPNGGEIFAANSLIAIEWNKSTDPETDPLTYFLEYSENSGVDWHSIITNYGHENKLNDSSTEKTIIFSGNENQTIYIRIPKNAEITNATLNLTGFPSE